MPSLPVKWTIRALMGIAGFGILAFVWWMFAGSLKQRMVSPDNRVVAEVRQYNFRPATEAAETAVQIGPRFHLHSTTVFDGLNYGAEVTVKWPTSNKLVVKCAPCNNFHVLSKQKDWGSVSIEYDIQ